jgi:hypothetical protein
MSFLRRMQNWLNQGPTPTLAVTPVVSAPNDNAIEVKRRSAERQQIVDTARAMPLLDGVFAVLLYDRFRRNLGPLPHAVFLDLQEVFPYVPKAELADARARADKLIASAYVAGDSLLSSKFTNSSQVREQLAAANPGFGAESYEETIHYGCFQAR